MKTHLLTALLAIPLAACAPPTEPAADAREQPAAATAQTRKPEPPPAPPRPYPLKTCLVSGEDLDSMDERVSTVHQGQIFEFCCKPCLSKFRKDPAKYQALLASRKTF